jgi:hypothetical protein
MHLQFSKLQVAVAVLAVMVAPTTAAQASTLTYSDVVPIQRTNFTKSVSLPKFDTTLGDLSSILFELTGEVEGSIQLESLDAEPATVTGNLAAEISLQKPDGSPLLVTLPQVTKQNEFTTYDETSDYSGTSGATYKGLKDSKIVSTKLTLKSEFTPFLGSGSFTLPAIAKAKSGGTGAGNLLALINTTAGASVKIVYDYTPIKKEEPRRKIPESQTPFAAMGALGIGMLVTKKKWEAV